MLIYIKPPQISISSFLLQRMYSPLRLTSAIKSEMTGILFSVMIKETCAGTVVLVKEYQ